MEIRGSRILLLGGSGLVGTALARQLLPLGPALVVISGLTREEAEGCRTQAPDWSLMDGATRVERTYRFRDFRAAFAFVARAADLAEAEGHHPDISFGWGYAVVSLRTKKIKGLHENDFIMAAKLDRIFAAEPRARQGS